ncbi:hypothetical protein OROGR_003811 [Orobanche gracilis]
MGCVTSKLDDSPAVALCRDRRAFLDEAVRHRFAFSEAHAAYLHSLKAVGLSLDRFLNLNFDDAVLGSASPVLDLPTRRKGETHKAEPPGSSPVKIQHHLHSHSGSGSHLGFHSWSEDDDYSSGHVSFHNRDISSPIHHQHSYDGGFTNISYMRRQTTPSVAYKQRRPMSPETMCMGESSSSHYPYTDYSNNLDYDLHNGYRNCSNYGAGGDLSDGGLYPPSGASSSKPPPPPPSPPRSSMWDSLNPFDSFENNFPALNAPSHDVSNRVRDEEGIPDLEDERDDEVVKNVHGDQKLVDGKRRNKSKPLGDDSRVADDDMDLEHIVFNNATDAMDTSKIRGNANEFKRRGVFNGDSEVVKEIRVQFERASDFGNELAKFLEVGKLPYEWKRNSHNVASKILHLPAVFLQRSMSKRSDNGDHVVLNVDQDVGLRSKNLSSTLHKLYLWETKLYEEVKVEEKMRILHEQKSRKMKRMDERGSEGQKVEAARSSVRSLSSKIKIAIQVVDKISVKINTLRDEELWPQLNEFIYGLTKMWKSMLECHHNQCQAIGVAKHLDAIAFRKHFSDPHFEATRQLEHDLVNWTLGLSRWVGAQNGFVRALNNWLMSCLLYVPVETPDGVAPFSPGRIGAPQVFVICHLWSQLLDRVSEKEAVGSMREFTSNVLQIWDRDKAEMQRRMLANKDETNVRSLEKDQKMQKEIEALDRKTVASNNGMPSTGHVVYPSETANGGSFQASLQHVLEAMEMFGTNSLRVYEELLQRIEENRVDNEISY